MTTTHGTYGQGARPRGSAPMSDVAFRALLDFIMVDDPRSFPDATDAKLMERATAEARKRGFDGWPAAYHEFHPPSSQPTPDACRCGRGLVCCQCLDAPEDCDCPDVDMPQESMDEHLNDLIVQGARAALESTDGVPEDVEWDGVTVMFELVDGRIPLVYVNVSANLPDEEVRDEVDHDIDEYLRMLPTANRWVEAMHQTHGDNLPSVTVFVSRTPRTDERGA